MMKRNWVTDTGKVKTLTDFYGSVQEVHFDENNNEGVLKPDIDPEDTESE